MCGKALAFNVFEAWIGRGPADESPASRTRLPGEFLRRIGFDKDLSFAQIQLLRLNFQLTSGEIEICLRTSSAAAITAGPVKAWCGSDSPTE